MMRVQLTISARTIRSQIITRSGDGTKATHVTFGTSHLRRRITKMSWSVQAVGKPKAVAASLEKQFSTNVCAEPEESVRQAAKQTILTAVNAQREDSVIKVSASGSQNSSYVDGKWGAPYTNQLLLSVEPLYGFVE